MEEQKRLSFFKKMALAITDFRIYPYVLKTESVWKSFGYFIKLLLIVVLLMSTYFCGTIFSNVEGFIENYNLTDFQSTLPSALPTPSLAQGGQVCSLFDLIFYSGNLVK